MTVEFRLLNGIEALIDGRPVDLGHARQRLVLVALLVDANRPVSVNQLLERIWGGQPARSARDTMYSYLSRVRQALAGAPGVGIARHPEGYLLSIDPDRVDLHRFHRILARARSAGKDDRAVALFHDALELCRGVPFGTVDTPWINALRDALHLERFAAELDCGDVQLRLGRHAEALAMLGPRADEHPLDERLAGQLMLAAYRSGRRAEALQRYQRIRRRLADDLGMDPGQSLQRLHQQILNADPALAPEPPEPPPPVRAPLPRQLPAPPALFTGRRSDLAELSALLTADPGAPGGSVVIAVIGGVGGVGKTWLALRWAHDHLDRFPDGQLHVSLRGFAPASQAAAPAAALRGMLNALGVEPAAVPGDLDAQVGLYRSLVAGRRMLIVLDDARDTEQVTPLLPGSPSCTVLITSRRLLGGLVATQAARQLTVGTLAEKDARQLLALHLGAVRTAAEPEAVNALLRHCAGLPLALSIVAARAAAQADFPLEVLTEELEEAATRLDALDAGELSADLRAVFSSSYDALGPREAEAFGLLGLAPGPDISLAAAASLLGRPLPRARTLLRTLQTAHLVQQPVPGRYRLHDLVRLYATERCLRDLPADVRADAMRRLVGHYLHTAHGASRRLEMHPPVTVDLVPPPEGCIPTPVADTAAAVEWCAVEAPCLLAAQQYAADQGWHELVWQLAWSLFSFSRHNTDLTTRRAGLAAAERLGGARPRALAEMILGHALIHAGHVEAEEYLLRALARFERTGDVPGQAYTHQTIAWGRVQRGDLEEGRRHAESALRLYQTAGNRVWEARLLNNVGWIHGLLCDYEQARIACERALALCRENGSRSGEANALDSLGYIAHHTGRYTRALDYYHQSIALFRATENAPKVGEGLSQLADVHLAMGQYEEANRLWHQVLRLYLAQGRGAADIEAVRRRVAELDHRQRGAAVPRPSARASR